MMMNAARRCGYQRFDAAIRGACGENPKVAHLVVRAAERNPYAVLKFNWSGDNIQETVRVDANLLIPAAHTRVPTRIGGIKRERRRYRWRNRQCTIRLIHGCNTRRVARDLPELGVIIEYFEPIAHLKS